MKVIYTEKSLYFVKNGIVYLDQILRKVPAMIKITKEDYRTKLTSGGRSFIKYLVLVQFIFNRLF